MFRRKITKLDADQPKPPSKAEILEDLHTFGIDHMLVDKTRRRISNTIDINLIDLPKSGKAQSIESDEGRQLNEWWLKFEKFLGDIDELESYQKQFDGKKRNLATLDDQISTMADEIQTKIGDSLQKALDEVNDGERDLK